MPRRAGSGGQRGAPAGCGCELRNSDSLSATAIRGETEIHFSAGRLGPAVFSLKPSRRSPRCVGSILPKLTSASSIAAPIFCFALCRTQQEFAPKRNDFRLIWCFALACFLSVIFSDLALPAEAENGDASGLHGFAHAENRSPSSDQVRGQAFSGSRFRFWLPTFGGMT
jgi:hypothetical protein